MSSKPNPGRRPNAQERLAAKRAAAAAQRQQAARRKRLLTTVVAPIVAVVLVVAVLVIVKVATGAGGPKSGQKATAAASTVISEVTGVPAATLDSVGKGSLQSAPKAIQAPALTADGKPRVLYIGAEYCPFCAAERWAVVVALSRFGTFTNLGQTASSPSDVYPNTATLSFHGASYSSSTISFTGYETESNQAQGNSYAPLDTLTAADQALFTKYNAPPYTSSDNSGGIPFVDIGGKYIITGASYDPSVLQGKTHAQIASALADPTSPIAKAIDGTANVITAAVCASTSQQPSAVCTSAGVKASAAALTSGT